MKKRQKRNKKKQKNTEVNQQPIPKTPYKPTYNLQSFTYTSFGGK